jgi:RimJ/RimL family protein N-acetyltransferase
MRLQIGHLELRQFSAPDMRELYRVRNHESVRNHMSRPALIPYKSHVQWVKSELLANESLLLFLVRTRAGQHAVGLTQLRIADRAAEIGVMFREPSTHQIVTSVATVATLHLAFEHFELDEVFSFVISSHTPAIRFNKVFGAWEESSDRPGMVKLRLTRQVCVQNENYNRIFNRIKNRLRVDLS